MYLYINVSAKQINYVRSLKENTFFVKTKPCSSDSASTNKNILPRGQTIHINCARFSFSEQCTNKIKMECTILKKGQATFQLPCMLLSQGNVLNKP